MARDLTTGSPMRLIWSFALPTLFGMLFQQFYNMMDTMIVGQLLGASALASVGSTSSINFFVIGFCMGVCNGFAIPVAQRMGAGDYSQMRRCVANAGWLSALFAVVLTVFTGLFCRTILTVMRTPEDIFDGAYWYILIIFLGIPTTFLYNLLAAVIRALGDSKTPVYFLAISSVLNIALDLLLILYCHAGVAGAALATVISQGVSGLACLVFMVKRFPILHMTAEERRLDGRTCRTLCLMGIPMGLQYSITAIGSIVLQSAVNGLGSRYVASVAAGTKLFQVICCPFDAMGATMATYCGQNVGAIKLDRLGQGLRACSLLGLGYALLSFASIFFFAPQMALLFLNPGEEALIGHTAQYITTLGAFFFPLALVNILRFSIQGMGFSNLAILAGVMEMFARMGVATLLVPAIGYTGACFASPRRLDLCRPVPHPRQLLEYRPPPQSLWAARRTLRQSRPVTGSRRLHAARLTPESHAHYAAP